MEDDKVTIKLWPLPALLITGCLLTACGGPSATQQFQSGNTKLVAAWSHYYVGTSGEQGLTALGWAENPSALTLSRINQWTARSKPLASAIAQYDATLGPLAAKSSYQSDMDKLINADSTLIADLAYPDNQGGSKEVCVISGCVVFPLGNNKWSQDLLASQESETTVFADFGLVNTSGGPFATAH
jgi:hypothetical protein